MALEKYSFLDRLTKKLGARGCAVGWNPKHEDWDLKIRRGAMTEADIRVVIEHHGGPKRLARLSAMIQPTKPLSWTLGAVGALAGVLGGLGLLPAAAFLTASFAVLWIAMVVHADHAESVILAMATEVADELQKESNIPAQPSRHKPFGNVKVVIARDLTL